MTIPFAGFGNGSEPPVSYRVKAGDSVSALLVARGVDINGDGAEAALQRFKALNPQVGDIDHILPGQTIFLPTELSELTASPRSGRVSSQPAETGEPHEAPPVTFDTPPTGHDTGIAKAVDDLGELLEVRALTRGFLYFPMDERNDLRLELRRYPVLVFPEGARFLFASASDLPGIDQLQVMQNYWPQLHLVSIGPGQDSFFTLLDAFCGQLPAENHPRQVTITENGVSVVARGPWIVKIADAQTPEPIQHFIMPAGDPALPFSDYHLATYLNRHGVI